MTTMNDNPFLTDPDGGFQTTGEKCRSRIGVHGRHWRCLTCGAEAVTEHVEYGPSDVLHNPDCPYKIGTGLGIVSILEA